VRREAGDVEGRQQFGGTADMVVVVMGQQDRQRPEAVPDGGEHRGGLAGVDNDAPAVAAGQGPDVVVGQCRQGAEMGHASGMTGMADCRRIETMPATSTRRQPESRSLGWFRGAVGRQLVGDVQRLATPELTRIFGHSGLFLRPSSDHPVDLSGNMLARVISLHRAGRAFDGVLRCEDAELPIASDSLALVYALFPFESAKDPAALMGEIARVLKPDGIALLFSLNPWSPTRLRWMFQVGSPLGGGAVVAMAAEAGLDVVRRRHLGPCWASGEGMATTGGRGLRLLDPVRAVSLVVVRRHDIPMTLQRKPMPAVSMQPGMSTG